MEKKNVHKFNIKIEKNEWDEAIKKAFDKKKKDIKVDGFRVGKVPFDVFVQKNDIKSLYMDAVDIILPVSYKKILDENKLVPILEPGVDLTSIDENGCEVTFTITTRPDVNIEKYTGLKVKKTKVKVTKEEIDTEIDMLLKRFSELTIKEGKVENGDVAVIDFEGFKDDVAFEGGKGENYSLEIGSNSFIPGFEENVIGMKTGDTKDISLTFPENYHSKDLAGAKVIFKVKVNEVKTKQTRELDADFYADLGLEGVDTKEALEKEIKANIEAAKESELENEYLDSLLSEIAKGTKVDIPHELIHEEIHTMVHRFEDQLKMQGLSLDVYLEMTKSSKEDLEKQMHPEAEKHVLYRYILETVKEKENIQATDEEANKELAMLASQYNMELDELKKAYGGNLDIMKYEIALKKTYDFLKENN